MALPRLLHQTDQVILGVLTAQRLLMDQDHLMVLMVLMVLLALKLLEDQADPVHRSPQLIL